MKMYNYFLIGATAFSAGIIDKNNDKYSIALAEKGNVCGYEFSSAYKTDGNTFGYACETIGGQSFKDELIKRGALNETGGEYFPAVAPIISNRINRSGADCFFMTNIVNIEFTDNVYTITLTSFGGQFQIQAERIIDTTFEVTALEKSLNVYTTNGIYKHKVDIDNDDYSKIRIEIYEKLKNTGEQIILFASEFDYGMPYGNAVEAYDAGYEFDITSVPQSTVRDRYKVDDGEYDVIVVGLGTAGAVSALVAAKYGLKVLGIENLTCAGGQGTAGGVMSYYYGEKGGYYTEIDKLAIELGKSGAFVNQSQNIGSIIKTVALDMELVNITYKYHAMSVEVIKSDETTVTGIKYVYGGKIHTAKAKYVIDCTAEATVCIDAGCEMIGGRKSDGRFQPYSNVYYNYTAEKNNLGYAYIDNGVVDQYDPYEYGKAVLESSASYVHLRDDYSDRKYIGIVPLTGLREGRHILGEQTVRFAEYIDGNLPDNVIAYSLTNLDNHGKDSALEDRDYQDWITVCNLWGYSVGFPIPAGVLIPKDFDGILTAGRSVSLDHTAATGIRMKDDVQKTAEAAALIAVYSIKNNCKAKDVPYNFIREELYKTGCLKDGDEFKIYMQGTNDLYHGSNDIWKDSVEDVLVGLDSDNPGYFIWCARIMGDKIKSQLIEALNSDNKRFRYNAALALGLMDCAECEPVILEMITDKSGHIDFSGRKYNILQAISAISIAGRLGLGSASGVLMCIIKDKNYADDIPFTPYDLIVDRDDLYFQFISNAVIALLRIGGKNTDILSAIDGFKFETSMMGTKGFKLDVTPTVVSMVKKYQ